MKEALKLALDALTYIYTETTADEDELIDQAITALRLAIDVQNMASESTYKAALAQEQEPWCMKMNGCKTKCEDCPVEVAQEERNFCPRCGKRTADLTVIHTCTPPQQEQQGCYKRFWVGLTDDEVYKIAFDLEGEHWRKIADAIEAKLKEKNT